MAGLPGLGDEFAGYRLERLLGSGAMGAVYAATQARPNREVALKVLLPQFAADPEYRSRLDREAESMARIDSPHIIQIYEYGEHDGCLYIATQLVTGGDLDAFLREHGPLVPEKACTIAAQVASALGEAHEAGVIHRDVKSSNVLLRTIHGKPHAYLCDFGIATTGDERLTAGGSIAGTWAYLAPERCQGADATPATDIYALGCLVWKMLTGRIPYSGNEAHQALQHLNAPIPQLSGTDPVSSDINGFLLRAMAKQPVARISDAGDVRTEMEHIASMARRLGVVSTAPALPAQSSSGTGDSGGSGTHTSAPSGPSAPPSWAPEPAPGDPTPPAPPPQPEVRISSATYGVERERGPRFRTAVLAAAATGIVLVVVVIVMALGALLFGGGDDPDSDAATTKPSPTASADASTMPTTPVDRTKWVAGQVDRRLLTGDFDGNGLVDVAALVGASEDTAQVEVMRAAGAKLGKPATWADGVRVVPDGPLAAGDVNGDGRADLVLVAESQAGKRTVAVALSTGRKFSAFRTWAQLPDTDGGQLAVGDLTGDGMDDAVVLAGNASSSQVLVLVARGSGFAAAKPWASGLGWPAATTPIRLVDTDADRVPDLVALPGGAEKATDAVVLRGRRNGLAKPASWGPVDHGWGVAAADFSGDGMGDLAVIRPMSGGVTIDVLRSDGRGFRAAQPWLSIGAQGDGTIAVHGLMLRGDRAADLVAIRTEGDQVTVSSLTSIGHHFQDPRRLVGVPDWTWPVGP
ncbi:protein kinase domain-containing protein [Nocardioides speluncae]|uniref:protein kinase domain-containing protein n=1 Tax=Nocardioides speluncae TaxID=2670337 RepID=UPI000D689377|nr:protein kinase [Nocardioides speluncae]